MIVSKVTSKGQTTIPKEIRESLHAASGDMLAYEVQENGTVVIRKVEPFDVAWHAAVSGTLDEWASAEDEEAYRDL